MIDKKERARRLLEIVELGITHINAFSRLGPISKTRKPCIAITPLDEWKRKDLARKLRAFYLSRFEKELTNL